MDDPTGDPSLLDQARRALATAEGAVAREHDDPDWALRVRVAGTTPAAIQHAYLRHAAALGVVALAETCETLVAELAALRAAVDRMAGSPGEGP